MPARSWLSKLGLPIAHVESGLRSYRRTMPEEINRIVADHLSDLLLCPTELAVANLRSEGLEARAVLTGDVMYDASIAFSAAAERRDGPLAKAGATGAIRLATVHRAENTDDPTTASGNCGGFGSASHRRLCPVVWPMHPRTRNRLKDMGFVDGCRD